MFEKIASCSILISQRAVKDWIMLLSYELFNKEFTVFFFVFLPKKDIEILSQFCMGHPVPHPGFKWLRCASYASYESHTQTKIAAHSDWLGSQAFGLKD